MGRWNRFFKRLDVLLSLWFNTLIFAYFIRPKKCLLRNSYFRANGLYDECQGGLESIVRGMLKDPLMKVDRHFSNELTQHLFEVKDKFGNLFVLLKWNS